MRSFALLLALTTCELQATAGILTVYPNGITYHGMYVNPDVAKAMPNRLTDDGKWVWHPKELWATYESNSHVVYDSAFFEDCFGHQTIGIGVGYKFKELPISLGAGFLVRQHPIGKLPDGKTVKSDGAPIIWQNDSVQVIPLPYAGFDYNLFTIQNWGLVASVKSNALLTHFRLGIGHDL